MTRCIQGHELQPLPADGELYCPICEPSRALGTDITDEVLAILDLDEIAAQEADSDE